MSMMTHDHNRNESMHGHSSNCSVTAWYKTPKALVCLALAIAVGAYLWTYHSQHVLALLPFALFLACPLMHLFMHGGHGHQHGSDSTPTDSGSAS